MFFIDQWINENEKTIENIIDEMNRIAKKNFLSMELLREKLCYLIAILKKESNLLKLRRVGKDVISTLLTKEERKIMTKHPDFAEILSNKNNRIFLKDFVKLLSDQKVISPIFPVMIGMYLRATEEDKSIPILK